MSPHAGDERNRHSDLSREKITLSLPAEFFSIVSDEFEQVRRLLDSQQAVIESAQLAQRQEAVPGEHEDTDKRRSESDPDQADHEDRLDRLVLDLLGKDLDALQLEQPDLQRRTYSVASAELYQAAAMIGAQARHRLDRLAIAFDQIAGEPVRRELARRRIEDSSERQADTGG